MDNASLQRFKDALAQNDRIGIVVGKSSTVDEMAAALSLYLSLRSANKMVAIASAIQPIVEHSSLVGIDEVKSSLGGSSGDLVVSFPYQEGEIEKVSYTIDAGYLNIVVKAGENGLTFTEQDVRFTRGGGGMPSLLLVVGASQLALLGDIINPEALKDTTIVNIDTKPDNQGFGDIVLVTPQYSSVSELAASLLLNNGLPMDVDTAQNLMSGISFATNNFQSPQTSYFAFEMVAELMRRGAIRAPIGQPQAQPQPQMGSYMQPQPQPQPQQQPVQRPQQMQRPQGVQRPQYNQQNQQRGQQQQSHNQPRPQFNQQRGQQQQQQRQNNPGNQANRQDEIRRALAEQARSMQQSQPPMNQGGQPQSQPMPQPQNQPIQQPQQPTTTPQDEAPSDWLTPKVYKGSSNLS
jgi:hypothetical protein